MDSTDANWQCSGTDAALQDPAACSVFKRAGESFVQRVTGKAYDGSSNAACSLPTTPNYRQDGLVLASAVIAPSGANAGLLSTTSVNVGSGGLGSVAQAQSEVGIFRLTATPPTGAYFGQTAPTGQNNFGRFIPAGFTVSGQALTNRVAAACSSVSTFSYLGEAVGVGFTLQAVNLNGAITGNYRGNYARLNLAPVTGAGSNGLAFGAQSGGSLLNSRLSSSCTSCAAFVSGSSAIQARLSVLRATGSQIDGPFDSASFGLVATDADSVGMRGPDFNWDLAGAPEGVALGSTRLVFGRLQVGNTYGSALLPLPVTARAQMWNGSTFIDHGADSCTPFQVPATVSVNSSNTATLACNGGVGLYGSLAGVNASVGATAAGGTVKLSGGASTLRLSPPTNTGGGYLDLVLAAPDYLKYNVDGVDQSLPGCTTPGDGYLHDDNPRARIRFGVKTNSGVIHQREIY
ncbi:MAG: hypothetical protein CGU28_17045 [Candidatus Dactylopiibacterium carminicum]|uniref:DUF6701 domain-containing protein n=1 Tax=Candidatus Dactylopiibacterium carminicum TaxID=857335 RepID=A0A272EMG9_9RHOO|nr:DUF6701 domain-containing protein [Candidatus Dactylopiibacterium carminicum]KAF7597705.1 hypothetical protein BGI27_17325 [Candidatus Dactylopiibacterium carminicum]PAS91314.1 MAG: hypothetical protein CGU29_17125 [Candidatus Dactylopiibacterium carminicum]PAS92063.1 MAG: hypothetical protein CGU28_17045 [Candidatus Dactylopiibacterium carminicum]PAS94510.1 MAG: hypothetical protein BSR46_17365 [Candidatus Dactylopiibacterium carminicum]